MSRRPRSPHGNGTAPQEALGQLGLFGGPPTPVVPAQRPHPDQPAGPGAGLGETNDVDLITTIAGNAARGLYVLVGANERVYVRTDGPDSVDVQRVPRYEEAAVHQLLRRRWLNPGGRTKDLSCGAATLTGTSVSCPASTRARVHRWNALAQPASWNKTPPAAKRPALRVVRNQTR